MEKNKLSTEEKEILDLFESDKLISSRAVSQDIRHAKIAADNFMKKNQRINIRLKEQDLSQIKRIAAQEGIPYQTLISSILHKYAAGYLKIDKAS